MSKKVAIIIIIGFIIVSNVLTSVFRNSYKNKTSGDSTSIKEQTQEDKEAPVLELKDDKLILYQDDVFNYEAFILEAYDEIDGDLLSEVKHNEIDTSCLGIQKLVYSVKDKSGNEAIKEVQITILEKLSVDGD